MRRSRSYSARLAEAALLASAAASAAASTMTSTSMGPVSGGDDAPSGGSMAAGTAGRSVDGILGSVSTLSTRRMFSRCEVVGS